MGSSNAVDQGMSDLSVGRRNQCSISYALLSASLLCSCRGTHRLVCLPGTFLRGALLAPLSGDRQQHLALALDPLLRLLAFRRLRGGRGFLLGGQALLERVHQVDDVSAALWRG